MKEQINLTKKVAQSVATSLQDLLSRLKAEKAELEERISQVERDLSVFGQRGSLGKKTQRRKWGQNRQEIQEFLNANPAVSFASDVIATKLNIPRSSTLSTLQRLEQDGLATHTPDGFWMKKYSQ